MIRPILRPGRRSFWLAFVLSACATALPASAQVNPSQPRTPPQLSPVAQANKDVAAANLALIKAKQEWKKVIERLHKEMEATPRWKEAQAALKSAQAEQEKLKAPVLEKLKKQPEYATALAAQKKAELEKGRVYAQEPADPAARTKATADLTDATKNVQKVEEEAMAIEPSMMTAESKINDAQASLMALNAEFEKKCEENSDWQAAKMVVDEATTKVATARTALLDAQKQAAASRAKPK